MMLCEGICRCVSSIASVIVVRAFASFVHIRACSFDLHLSKRPGSAPENICLSGGQLGIMKQE